MADYIVNTDTGVDYASNALAEAALPYTFTEEHNIVSSGADPDTTVFTVAGQLPTEDYKLIFKPSSADQHDGFWDGSKFNFLFHITSSATVTGVSIIGDHVVVDGLQVEMSSTADARSGNIAIRGSTKPNILVKNCYFKGDNLTGSTYTGATGLELHVGSSGTYDNLRAENNIFTGFNATDSCHGLRLYCANYRTATMYALNNTAYNNHNGITFYAAGASATLNAHAKNNISVGNTVDFLEQDSTVTHTSSNNLSSDTSVTSLGIGTLASKFATDTLTDPANGDFTLKSGSDAIGAGADLSSDFTTDITGATRSVPWDIGAFLYSSGGSTVYDETVNSILTTVSNLIDRQNYHDTADTLIQSGASLSAVAQMLDAVTTLAVNSAIATDQQQYADSGTTTAVEQSSETDQQAYTDQADTVVQEQSSEVDLQDYVDTGETTAVESASVSDQMTSSFSETLLTTAISAATAEATQAYIDILTSLAQSETSVEILGSISEQVTTVAQSLSSVAEQQQFYQAVATTAVVSSSIDAVQEFIDRVMTTAQASASVTDILVGQIALSGRVDLTSRIWPRIDLISKINQRIDLRSRLYIN